MRVLFVAAGSPATVFALAPLAAAARAAGHEAFVAATADMAPVVSGAGLPAVAMTERSMRDFMFTGRDGAALVLPTEPGERMFFGGRGFGRLAAAALEPLSELSEAWRPDVIVGGTLSFAGALLAARLGVPYVRHAWDMGEPPEMDEGAAAELGPELARLGLDGMPGHDLWIHICPPSLLAPGAEAGPAMRFVPAGRQRRLEPWMYTRPPGRRVCVTAGSRVSQDHEIEFLAALADRVGALDVEVVVAAPEEVAAALAERRPGIRAGWLPLDSVLRTCDVLVHAGGGQTSLTAMSAAVPQLVVPTMPKLVAPARRLAAAGAAMVLPLGEDSADAVATACEELLHAPSYRAGAAALGGEMAGLPGPSEVLAGVEALVGADARRGG